MSDDRIIDFNELKNKVKDSDVDKFEQYIYSLYGSVMNGSLSMVDFSKKILDYMNENGISHEKFYNIQKKFMERYGMDPKEVDEQLKSFGLDPNNLDFNNINNNNFEDLKKTVGFYEKYTNDIQAKTGIQTTIKNEHNDLTVTIDQENITLISKGKINLMDAELNEFLLSYKNMLNKTVKVVMCESVTEYNY